MTGRINQRADHYFCKCGFSCRTKKVWNDHTKVCKNHETESKEGTWVY